MYGMRDNFNYACPALLSHNEASLQIDCLSGSHTVEFPPLSYQGSPQLYVF